MKKIIFIFLVLVLCILAYVYFRTGKNAEEVLDNAETAVLEPPRAVSDDENESARVPASPGDILFQAPSQDNTMMFVVLKPAGYPGTGNTFPCPFEVRDSKGNAYDLSSVFSKQEILCSEGMIGTVTPFITWGTGGRFLMSDTDESVVLVDLRNKRKTTYSFDTGVYSLASVNAAFTRWLLRKKEPVSAGEFSMFDEEHQLIADISIPGIDRPVLYDPVNLGFLFIRRDFGEAGSDGESAVSVRFDFLPEEATSVRHLLTTDRIQTPGRGCYPENIVSEKKGEIILTQGCLILNKKYLGSDGNIHIPL